MADLPARRCWTYTAAGGLCGRPATVLDRTRGCYVCGEHAPIEDALAACYETAADRLRAARLEADAAALLLRDAATSEERQAARRWRDWAQAVMRLTEQITRRWLEEAGQLAEPGARLYPGADGPPIE